METGASTAVFLQARINALTTTLVQRIENIYAIALPPSTDKPASLTTIAVDQLQVDVEAAALVRAAEEVMVLTRRLKDLWLFGGLDSVRRDGREDGEGDENMQEDARVVGGFIRRLVNGATDGIEDEEEKTAVGDNTRDEGNGIKMDI